MKAFTTTKSLLAAATFAAVVGGQPAHAATATGTLAVSALVLSTCVVTPATLSFPTYILAAADAQGSITVTCTGDVTSYTVGLGAGSGAGATTTVRKMTSVTSGVIEYRMYKDSGRSQNWGSAGAELMASSGASNDLGAVKTFTVYGRIPADQTSVGAGSGGLLYQDSVQITVNY